MEFWNNPVEFARVLGLLVPLAVALLTRINASSAVKSVANIALSAVAATVAMIVGADGGWDWGGFFNAWFNAFLTGIVAYYGALKPMGIAPKVAANTPGFIGGSSGQKAA